MHKAITGLFADDPSEACRLFATLTGGALGLFAPVGVVKWLLQTEPEAAGILTLFFLPVWCLLVVLGLLRGRRLGVIVTGGRAVQRVTAPGVEDQ